MNHCRHCGTAFDAAISRTCPACGKKLPGPSKGTGGRPASKTASSVRNARIVWVRLNRAEAARMAAMLNKTTLDGAKLGRAALAAVDKLRGKKRVDTYLRNVLGDDYDAIVRG